MFGVVYLIFNKVNGKMYVGQTTKTIDERFSQHATCKTTLIGKAIQKYGRENFRCDILKRCASKVEMDAWEKFFIAALKTKIPLGYNLTDGGEGATGCPRSDETRAKISAANKGREVSDETRAKLSAANIGKQITDETRAKIAMSLSGGKNHNYGKHPSPSTLEKMSEAKRGEKNPNYGKHPSPATREKLSEALSGEKNPRYGKKNTPEHQAKIVASNLGKKRTPETCKNISEALKGKPFTVERCANISAAKRKESLYPNLMTELVEYNLSYAALGKLLNLASSIVSRKMRGERNFTARDKEKLEEIFGKPAEYLLERDD